MSELKQLYNNKDFLKEVSKQTGTKIVAEQVSIFMYACLVYDKILIDDINIFEKNIFIDDVPYSENEHGPIDKLAILYLRNNNLFSFNEDFITFFVNNF